jgi:predicted DsbA family dithiol-disulfide isomerase
VLVTIAAAHGLDANTTRAQLLSDTAHDHVIAEAHWAQEHGIGGVPCLIIDNRYALSGAQPPHVILQALHHAAAQRQTAS